MRIITPREIWRREDEDFSPWLTKNLDLLDEILDTELGVIELERRVGPFFADILCLNKKDSSYVVIENQLEKTDHKHLGQLLTYATGLQARTIIWIATEFEQEHRNVLEWLNDNMTNSFRFFGVKLELIAIDTLRCEPRFTLIAEPRPSRHTQSTDASMESRFWSELRQYLNKKDRSLNSWEKNKHPQYFGIDSEGIKRNVVWLGAWRRSDCTQIAAKLFLRREVDYDRLREQQDYIETEFRNQRSMEKLEWDRNPRYSPYPQVGVYNRRVLAAEPDWTNQFEWIYTNIMALDRVFRSLVAQF